MQWSVEQNVIAALVLVIFGLLGIYILSLRDELARWRRMALTGQGVQEQLINVVEETADRRRYLTDLRRRLVAHLSEDELDTLIFDLGVEDGAIQAATKQGKARELLEWLERRGRVSELVKLLRVQRPDMWQQTDI